MSFIDYLTIHIQNKYLLITLVSMLPLSEVKAGILLGLSLNLNPLYVYLVCFLASSIPVPLILLVLRPFLKLLRNKKKDKLAGGIEKGILAKFQYKGTEKHIFAKLFTFVALPIPLTGAYTGSAVAVLINIPIYKGMTAVILGNAVAALMVLAIGMAFSEYADKILFGFILLIPIFMLATIIKNKFKHKSKTNSQNKNN